MSINGALIYIFGISYHHIKLPCTWFPSVRIPLTCMSFKRPVGPVHIYLSTSTIRVGVCWTYPHLEFNYLIAHFAHPGIIVLFKAIMLTKVRLERDSILPDDPDANAATDEGGKKRLKEMRNYQRMVSMNQQLLRWFTKIIDGPYCVPDPTNTVI